MSAGMLSVIFVWLVAAIGVVIMKKLQPETWILYLVWVVVVCILLAVDSTATAYTSESNHVPYMLYDQTNKTLECRGFGSAGSIEPVDPYSLALEYKLEYDMDDTGLVKQIDANREAADSLKEDLADIATFVKLTDLVKDHLFISLIMSILMMKAGKRLQMYGLMR